MSRKYRQDAINRLSAIDVKIEQLKKKVADLNIEIRKLETEKDHLKTSIARDAMKDYSED